VLHAVYLLFWVWIILTAKVAINLWAWIKPIGRLFGNPGRRVHSGFEGSDKPADDFEVIDADNGVFGFFIFAHIWFTPFQMCFPDADRS
jgi:hypothetical protein